MILSASLSLPLWPNNPVNRTTEYPPLGFLNPPRAASSYFHRYPQNPMNIIEAMNMMRRLESLPEIYRETDKAVINTVHAYFSELYEIEIRDKSVIESGNNDSDYLSKSVAERTAIHKKYWSNPALFYVPCSMSSDPQHD